jgi:hypothetical protein
MGVGRHDCRANDPRPLHGTPLAAAFDGGLAPPPARALPAAAAPAIAAPPKGSAVDLPPPPVAHDGNVDVAYGGAVYRCPTEDFDPATCTRA